MEGYNQWLFFFSTLGAFNGLLLSLYFAISAKRKIFTNYFLSLLLFVLSIRIIKSVFFYFNPHLSNIFIQIGLSACILIGPFLYLYLKSQAQDRKPNWQFHVLPYLIGITILGIVYPYVDHRTIWSRWIVMTIYLQWFIYIIAALRYILPIFRRIKETGKLDKLNIWLLSIYLGVLFIWMAYTIAAYTSYIVGALSFTFILYLIILLLAFKNDKTSSFFQEKYKNKELDVTTIDLVKQKLAVIIEEELFLNPNFTLDKASRVLKIPKHVLSQYLNEKLGKSFTSFISEHRIEKAKALLQTKSSYTVESLGYDSGFNSKSAFFTTFKKITGKTPSEYQKMYSK